MTEYVHDLLALNRILMRCNKFDFNVNDLYDVLEIADDHGLVVSTIDDPVALYPIEIEAERDRIIKHTCALMDIIQHNMGDYFMILEGIKSDIEAAVILNYNGLTAENYGPFLRSMILSRTFNKLNNEIKTDLEKIVGPYTPIIKI